ncbi:MAG: 16S rRNA (guanine(966)-N(2))-methyltransferase RsmD [Bacteroidetes bacterium]|jgi:16S rRNA (guanine(966)-N(2))-methyltransferase RsmD|nr:16S rRNA (guanine(966)-N(2))-methyltransferase RsmD [Bacteroidota bacterium]
MRIITGKLKGRTIPVPKTGLLRPTSDRAKEALFSVIDARTYFVGTRVLDLFAGSGSLGLEAISRGADFCAFVDEEPEHIKHIEKLSLQFNIEDQVRTYTMDVEIFLETNPGGFDFIFADPPYDYYDFPGLVETILSGNWLNNDGMFILEHSKDNDFESHEHCVFSKAYGRTVIAMFKLNGDF